MTMQTSFAPYRSRMASRACSKCEMGAAAACVDARARGLQRDHASNLIDCGPFHLLKAEAVKSRRNARGALSCGQKQIQGEGGGASLPCARIGAWVTACGRVLQINYSA